MELVIKKIKENKKSAEEYVKRQILKNPNGDIAKEVLGDEGQLELQSEFLGIQTREDQLIQKEVIQEKMKEIREKYPDAKSYELEELSEEKDLKKSIEEAIRELYSAQLLENSNEDKKENDKPEVKVETKAENKPEAKPENKPESKEKDKDEGKNRRNRRRENRRDAYEEFKNRQQGIRNGGINTGIANGGTGLPENREANINPGSIHYARNVQEGEIQAFEKEENTKTEEGNGDNPESIQNQGEVILRLRTKLRLIGILILGFFLIVTIVGIVYIMYDLDIIDLDNDGELLNVTSEDTENTISGDVTEILDGEAYTD